MVRWTPLTFLGEYPFEAERLARLWTRLHTGDAEPLPRQDDVLQAWVLFHQGDFEGAARAGLAGGAAGITVANKATAAYALHVEPSERTRLDLFMEVARRAEAQAAAEPENASAWYMKAYALGKYSQGISVAKALAQGLAGQVKGALEHVIRLQPRHADAHICLGTYHAEVIDKVGALIGGMSYGAKKDMGLRLYREGLRLNPDSASAMIECASGLLMLEGTSAQEEANRLYEKAAAFEALDALERLNVERARLELQD